MGALAVFGCLRALSTVLDSVSSLPHLFPQLEEILFPIMQAMCTEEGQDVFEEILEMISYFTYFSPEVCYSHARVVHAHVIHADVVHVHVVRAHLVHAHLAMHILSMHIDLRMLSIWSRHQRQRCMCKPLPETCNSYL